MRSRSPLALMEQLVMVLVFALAAALCLQVFAFADRMSRHSEVVDRAVLACQNAAESMKAAGGDMAHAQRVAAQQMGGSVSQGLLQVRYDADWNVIPDGAEKQAAYILEVSGVPTEVEGLWKANVRAAAEKQLGVGGGGALLFELDVAWQEVSAHG